MILNNFTKNKKLIFIFVFFIFIGLYSIRTHNFAENFKQEWEYTWTDITEPSFTPPVVPTSGVCAKDLSCFDANYECAGCCSTDRAKDGAECWDATYTKARCCNNTPANIIPVNTPSVYNPPVYNPPVYNPPVYNPPVVTTSGGCAKDPSCFNEYYECTGCCSTGRAKDGASCWDSTYTSARCCINNAGTGITNPGVFNPAVYPPVFPGYGDGPHSNGAGEKILVIGDSNSETTPSPNPMAPYPKLGYFDENIKKPGEANWVDLLQKEYDITNNAIRGHTAEQQYKFLEKEINTGKIDVNNYNFVIIVIGTNEIKQGRTFEMYIPRIIDMFKNTNAKILLVKVISRSLGGEKDVMNTFLEKHVELRKSLNMNIKLLEGPQELYTGYGTHYNPDQIHINNLGHQVLYFVIKTTLAYW